jgi:hypothetical protein
VTQFRPEAQDVPLKLQGLEAQTRYRVVGVGIEVLVGTGVFVGVLVGIKVPVGV